MMIPWFCLILYEF